MVAGVLDIDVGDAYSKLNVPRAGSRRELAWCLEQLEGHRFDRVVSRVPWWTIDDDHATFGAPSHHATAEWFAYARMAVDGGYYGIASVVFEGTGLGTRWPPPTNHVVLLCGVREVEVPLSDTTSRLDLQVLVSCSAIASSEWIEVDELLSRRGGYNAIWVRPRTSDQG